MSWSGQSWGPGTAPRRSGSHRGWKRGHRRLRTRWRVGLAQQRQRHVSAAEHGPLRLQLPHGVAGREAPTLAGGSDRRRPRRHHRLRRCRRLDGTESVATARSSPMRFVIADLGYDHGWRVDQHPRSSPTSPATGTPTSSASATPASGSRSATATAPSRRRRSWSSDLGYNQGWRVDQHPRFVVDLTGDGKADIVGFGDAGVWVALGNGDGTLPAAAVRARRFRPGQGLAGHQAPAHDWPTSTAIGRADIVGFGDAGVWIGTQQRRRAASRTAHVRPRRPRATTRAGASRTIRGSPPMSPATDGPTSSASATTASGSR